MPIQKTKRNRKMKNNKLSKNETQHPQYREGKPVKVTNATTGQPSDFLHSVNYGTSTLRKHIHKLFPETRNSYKNKTKQIRVF